MEPRATVLHCEPYICSALGKWVAALLEGAGLAAACWQFKGQAVSSPVVP
jgi:hypothetical protein